ncbi:MAG TPA: hypothetical protein DCW29_09340 [Janthinobacterium sp.]|nr:hypothetical protein [Janthinobacterium sp.]
MNTVSLVATPERLKADFPKLYRALSPNATPGPQSGMYEVDPLACATALGRWLAGSVGSTHADAAESLCNILLPQTEEGVHVRELAERLMLRQAIANEEQAEALYADIEAWIAARRGAAKIVGSYAFRHRVIRFQWPVFGAAAAEGAASPAAYFEVCAKQIRATGGVIIDIGGLPLPANLAKSMALNAGGGDQLLARYRSQQVALRTDPLIEFSEGRITRELAIAALGFRDYAALLLALAQAGLAPPAPTPDQAAASGK